MDIIPVVESLAAPEGDLRRALDDILHLDVGLYDTGTPTIVVEVKSGLFVGAVEKLEGILTLTSITSGSSPSIGPESGPFQYRSRFRCQDVAFCQS